MTLKYADIPLNTRVKSVSKDGRYENTMIKRMVLGKVHLAHEYGIYLKDSDSYQEIYLQELDAQYFDRTFTFYKI